jgi:tripartite-type tricarboxylate transporter receptor subunit TctC
MPDVPTFGEQGFPGFEIGTWFALFAPSGTPKAIVDQLNGYVRGLDDDPEMRKRLDAAFLEPMPMNAAEFGAQVQADAAKWERIVRESGVKQD